MSCAFCDSKKLQPRTFYEDANWLAFLAAPPHTRGHTIFAAVDPSGACPQNTDEEVLSGISGALAKVIQALKKHFERKDVLFASLRGSVRHFHLHLIPLWEEQEANWRKSKADQDFYERGHLLEYLGTLEERGDRNAADERGINDWSEDEQRENVVKQEQFQRDLAALCEITGYDRA